MNFQDVFPTSGEAVPAGDHNGYSFISRPCKLCGSLCAPSGFWAHINFHEDLERRP